MMFPTTADTPIGASPPGRIALLLLAPTGSGIHSVVHQIKELTDVHVELCVRDSTRIKQVWDNGTLRSVPEEFGGRMTACEYLAVMNDDAGKLYGHRKTDVEDILRKGSIPVLRGLPGHAPVLGKWFAERDPAVRLVTVFMTTDPADAWKGIVKERGFDVESRIAAADKVLLDLGLTNGTATDASLKRFGIDHLVVNRWGHLDETVRAIAVLLR